MSIFKAVQTANSKINSGLVLPIIHCLLSTVVSYFGIFENRHFFGHILAHVSLVSCRRWRKL